MKRKTKKTNRRKMTAAKVEELQMLIPTLPLIEIPLREPSDEAQELGKAAPWDDIRVNPNHPDWVKLFEIDADMIEAIDVSRVKTPKEALPYKPAEVHADEDEVGRRFRASWRKEFTEEEFNFIKQYLTTTGHAPKDRTRMSRLTMRSKKWFAHKLAELQHFILLSGVYGGLHANEDAKRRRAAWERERE